MAHTTLFPAALGTIRLMHTVTKKNGIAHCFTTWPLPAKAESRLVAKLKVKGYSLWIKHPPACCIEHRPQATPLHSAYCTAQCPHEASSSYSWEWSATIRFDQSSFIGVRPLPCVGPWPLPCAFMVHTV